MMKGKYIVRDRWRRPGRKKKYISPMSSCVLEASWRPASQPASQLVLKCKKINVSFRSPGGRLARGRLPRMQREKRLRRNTFCEDPDSHGRRSVSSRWQRSRSHFVQTNNTAVSPSPPPPPRERTDQEVGSTYVTLDQPNSGSKLLLPPPASPPLSPSHRAEPAGRLKTSDRLPDHIS